MRSLFDSNYNNISCLHIRWVWFGSNNLDDYLDIPNRQKPLVKKGDKSILETFYRRDKNCINNMYISGKLISNPNNVIFGAIHCTHQVKTPLSIIDPNILHINHYQMNSTNKDFNDTIDTRIIELKYNVPTLTNELADKIFYNNDKSVWLNQNRLVL
jgi:hypothetical protein